MENTEIKEVIAFEKAIGKQEFYPWAYQRYISRVSGKNPFHHGNIHVDAGMVPRKPSRRPYWNYLRYFQDLICHTGKIRRVADVYMNSMFRLTVPIEDLVEYCDKLCLVPVEGSYCDLSELFSDYPVFGRPAEGGAGFRLFSIMSRDQDGKQGKHMLSRAPQPKDMDDAVYCLKVRGYDFSNRRLFFDYIGSFSQSEHQGESRFEYGWLTSSKAEANTKERRGALSRLTALFRRGNAA